MPTPKYYSSRDSDKKLLSFEDALLKGLAPDGGLFLPEFIPQVDPKAWEDATSIADIGVAVLYEWLKDEIDYKDLEKIVRDALNFEVPMVSLRDDLTVLELFHGPTLSFKDFGARTMARLMQHFLAKRSEKRIILVATSGDTGSAVADGFAGMDNISVVLLYPKGKVSEVQERQLIVKRKGVQALAVKGDFDDCQRMVKEAFVDKDLAELPLSSANSINIGRLLPQSLYYLWAASQSKTRPLNFCVPSGNLGNLTSAIIASLMGLKVDRFIAAHNKNDFFPRFLSGKADAFEFKATTATLSNAMDVGAPSNFERLFNLLSKDELSEMIWSTSVDDEDTIKRMKLAYDNYEYVACPHTAVGLEAVNRYRKETNDESKFITVATAHPAKFPEALSQAIWLEPPRDDSLEALKDEATNVIEINPKLKALKRYLLKK